MDVIILAGQESFTVKMNNLHIANEDWYINIKNIYFDNSSMTNDDIGHGTISGWS